MTANPMSHDQVLDTLARMAPDRLKAHAETVLPDLGKVDVVQSRTGLVMAPMRDTVQGTDFHLGEVLVAEAHIRLPATQSEGYGMVLGIDLERAMAMALLDAALDAGVQTDALHQALRDEAARHAEDDTATLREVEATRVAMETF